MTLEAVTSNNNMKGLCYLFDSIESHVRGLEPLGVSAETYGNLLSSVLMNKLPSKLRLIIGRKVRDEEWDLSVILQEFLLELVARERSLNSGGAHAPSS